MTPNPPSLPPQSNQAYPPKAAGGKSCWMIGCVGLLAVVIIGGGAGYWWASRSGILDKAKNAMNSIGEISKQMQAATTSAEVIAALGSPVTMESDAGSMKSQTTVNGVITQVQEMKLKGPKGEGMLRLKITIPESNPLGTKFAGMSFVGPDGVEKDILPPSSAPMASEPAK